MVLSMTEQDQTIKKLFSIIADHEPCKAMECSKFRHNCPKCQATRLYEAGCRFVEAESEAENE